MASRAAAKTFAQRWVYLPEVYPLYFTIGAAMGICSFNIGRTFFSSPDVLITKTARARGVPEHETAFKEGQSYKFHPLRQSLKGVTPQIFANQKVIAE